jgi:hypothetical protein
MHIGFTYATILFVTKSSKGVNFTSMVLGQLGVNLVVDLVLAPPFPFKHFLKPYIFPKIGHH